MQMRLTTGMISHIIKDRCIREAAISLASKHNIPNYEEVDSGDTFTIEGKVRIDDTLSSCLISIYKDSEEVQEAMCTCGKCSIDSPCIHSAALLYRAYMNSSHHEPIKEKKIYHDHRVISLIEDYRKNFATANEAAVFQNSVTLELQFEVINAQELAVSFRIGKQKLYVIKSIAAFTLAMRQHDCKEYGKDFSFYHTLDGFREEDKALVEFILAHEDDNHIRNQRPYAKLDAKQLYLKPSALDELLSLLKKQQVKQISLKDKQRGTIDLDITYEQPKLILNAYKDHDDYYTITLNIEGFLYIDGDQHGYLINERTLYVCDKEFHQNCKNIIHTLRDCGSLTVHKSMMPSFYQNVLQSINPYIALHGNLEEFLPQEFIAQLYLDMPDKDSIAGCLKYVYEHRIYHALEPRREQGRNEREEVRIFSLLKPYILHQDKESGYMIFADNETKIYEFLHDVIPLIQRDCEIYTSQELNKYKIKRLPKANIGVHLQSELLQIEIDMPDISIQELLLILKAYKQKKKYYRLSDGSFLDLNADDLEEISEVADAMHLCESDIHDGIIELEHYRALSLDQALKHSQTLRIEKNAAFRKAIRSIRNIEDSDYDVPYDLKHTLRNYQIHGYRWLKTMAEYGFGAILADDMGIGKTLQIIALLEDDKIYHPEHTSLVVCPSSLILNWDHEIHKFTQNLNCAVVSGSAKHREALIEHYQDYDVLITSYDYLKRDLNLYQDKTFYYEIIDEAQYIKNQRTQSASSVKQIKSVRRFALTGTPIENTLAELWSIFDFLMPQYLFAYPFFKRNYETAIVKEQDETALKELKSMVEPFILRRIKQDVLKELPAKSESIMEIEFDEETWQLYQANIAAYKIRVQQSIEKDGFHSSKILILSMLTKLRQLCCDSRLLYEDIKQVGNKCLACMELVEQAIASSQKVLIFSQFTSMLDLIEEELHKQQISSYKLTGASSKSQRQEMVQNFEHDDTMVFLISLKAGGTGLNLTAAQVVIHVDPWWNVSAQNQATDRAYRMGQQQPVQVYKLIMKDSIEEKIMHLQEQKQQISNAIIQENEGVITSMDEDALLDLFQLY